MYRTERSLLAIALCIICLGFALVGCGRREPAGPTPTPQPTVTPLSATFKQPTSIIKAEAEKAEATPTPTVGTDLSRGQKLYTDKGCAECHGPQGEGVEGQGSALGGTALGEGEFETILRTGGQGQLGNNHLYGTQAISPSGMAALYAFIASLPAP
jgi:mono/diheme cytochrome c family protein